MTVRLTFIQIKPEFEDKLKKIYNEEIVPVVKSQQGNVGVWLLEPQEMGGEWISLTEWKTLADANLYESSGTYKKLVDKVRDMFSTKPVLRTYNIAASKVAAVL